MKVSIRTDGHTVEIETTEDGMNVHRLANFEADMAELRARIKELEHPS